jgi:hypothetical protein
VVIILFLVYGSCVLQIFMLVDICMMIVSVCACVQSAGPIATVHLLCFCTFVQPKYVWDKLRINCAMSGMTAQLDTDAVIMFTFRAFLFPISITNNYRCPTHVTEPPNHICPDLNVSKAYV